MNYQYHYDRLIQRAKNRQRPDCYCEEHHIVPRCVGGEDVPENLVYLTAREHFVAHRLLAKANPKIVKIRTADFMMGNINGRTTGSFYEQSKLLTIEILRESGKRVAEENQRLGRAIFAQTLEERREAGRKGGKIAGPRGGKTQGKKNKTNGVLEKARSCVDREKQKIIISKMLKELPFEERSRRSKISSGKNWICDVCGMKASAGTLGRHQKSSGHKGRTKNVQS